jgi:hypothetical protein
VDPLILPGELPFWLRFYSVSRNVLCTPPSWLAVCPGAVGSPERQHGCSRSVEIASFVTPGPLLGWPKPVLSLPFREVAPDGRADQLVPHGNRLSRPPGAEALGLATSRTRKPADTVDYQSAGARGLSPVPWCGCLREGSSHGPADDPAFSPGACLVQPAFGRAFS